MPSAQVSFKVFTMNCSTVRGKVAEYSRICLSLGRWFIILSNIPLKSWDNNLSA